LCDLIIITLWFLENKEKENKRNINNDLAVVASHIPVGVIHDSPETIVTLPIAWSRRSGPQGP